MTNLFTDLKKKDYLCEKIKQIIMVYSIDLTKRYSYADYLTWIDDVRRELIEGIVKMMPAPLSKHAEVSSNISWHLENVVRKKKGNCKVFHAPFDVRLPKDCNNDNNKIHTVVQPDISVICDLSKIDKRGCCGAPDMIVEIFSPSTGKRDLHDKFLIYQEAGVREYWIVYPENEAVNVFYLQGDGKYDGGHVYEFEGKVPVRIFEGVMIDLKDIFER